MGVDGYSVAMYLGNVVVDIDRFAQMRPSFKGALLIPKGLQITLIMPQEERIFEIDYTKEENEELILKSMHPLKNIEKMTLRWRIDAEIEGSVGEIMRRAETFARVFESMQKINLAKVEICSIESKVKFEVKKEGKYPSLEVKEMNSEIAQSQALSLNLGYELEYEVDIQKHLEVYVKTIETIIEEMRVIGKGEKIETQFIHRDGNLTLKLKSPQGFDSLSAEYLLDEIKSEYGEVEFKKGVDLITLSFPWMAIIQY